MLKSKETTILNFIPKYFTCFVLVFGWAEMIPAAPFIHPGGLHTRADLERMRANVLAGNHPWIDDWKKLLRDPQAQASWQPVTKDNIHASRQRADLDAHAAYLNALRWCISGDTNNAECAMRICNAWSSGLNHIPEWNDTPGLGGIPIFDFALAGELLRIYPGWQQKNFKQFTNMMVRCCYPVCHDFLARHNGACISAYWANWDAGNIGALIAMGVLCDDTNIFNEGVEYFKHGAGMGSISNAVPFLYSTDFAQWQESGRDQEHAQLGVGLLGSACQVAWNQGVDLFGYANNRLLAGAEYVAKCNLSYPASTIPYTFYNNCSDARQCYLSINGLGRLDRPVWELIYNHYVVSRGLDAPYVTDMAKLMRPEEGSGDHFGYGTLTFTLAAKSSPYPPNPIAPVPTGLRAEAGVSEVHLNWQKSPTDAAQGYIVRRATKPQGPFEQIVSWNANSSPQYTDDSVVNGTTYYYVVAARNQAGISADSASVSATPTAAGALPAGWIQYGVGTNAPSGRATFSEVGQNTFIVKGAGGNIGGKADSLNYTGCEVSGDFVIIGRLADVKWTGRDKVGLMVRESPDAKARAVTLTLGEIGDRQCRLGTRSQASAVMTWRAGNDYTWVPVWFKIQRAGDMFTGYQSVDGEHWFKAGSSTVKLSNRCLAGLAVSAQKKNEVNTTVFDHVAVQCALK